VIEQEMFMVMMVMVLNLENKKNKNKTYLEIKGKVFLGVLVSVIKTP